MAGAAEYQNPEDAAAFKGILERDPESRKCFECQYPNAPWCDINHGIFMCLDCSGVHRGLGVHLSFVRSSTMDGWSNWRPEKLRQMQIGGNARARKFFEAKGVPKAPIRARYEHAGALMYKDLLEAEVGGRPFNEAAWQPPEWAVPRPQQAQRSSGATAQNDRFRGQSGNSSSGASSSSNDWLGALSTGWSTVATQATQLAGTAAQVTVQGSQQLAAKLQETARTAPAVNTDELSKKAQETAAVAATAVTSAWGMLSSWTSSAVSTLSSAANGQADGEDDGLGSLTRNLHRDAPASDTRFRGVEHKAEQRSESLSALAGNLPRSNKYDGVGGEENPTAQMAAMSVQPTTRSTTGLGSRQTSATNVGSSSSSPTARSGSSFAPTPAPVKPMAAAATTAKPAVASPKPAEAPQEKKAIPSDWGWDDE